MKGLKKNYFEKVISKLFCVFLWIVTPRYCLMFMQLQQMYCEVWFFLRSTRIECTVQFAGLGIRSFALLLFPSKLLFLKSNRERFTLVPLYKGATGREPLLLLFKKERREGFALSLSKNNQFTQKVCTVVFTMFLTVFSLLFPFLCPRANCSHGSSLSCSFLKSNGSDLLLSL